MAPIMSPPAAIPCTSIGTVYRGGRGKGYAVTPETGRPAYIKTPLLPGRLAGYGELLRKLKKGDEAIWGRTLRRSMHWNWKTGRPALSARTKGRWRGGMPWII